jgi:hypothetical protein
LIFVSHDLRLATDFDESISLLDINRVSSNLPIEKGRQ